MTNKAKVIEGISRDIDTLNAREMCLLFPMIKDRLGRIGLLKTMHEFDAAQNALGWEVAEQLEKSGA
jgi:hypothetical protein